MSVFSENDNNIEVPIIRDLLEGYDHRAFPGSYSPDPLVINVNVLLTYIYSLVSILMNILGLYGR